ncbi:signal transducing kinase of the PAK, partial [Ceratobasidium sp. 392]
MSTSPLRASRATLDEYVPAPRDGGSYTLTTRPGGNTSANRRKSTRSFMDRLFNTQKRPEISTPYYPTHFWHVSFDPSTGEFSGLPKEWQQLLSDSGISRLEQERNPEAVIEVLRFYQETKSVSTDDVWDKINSSSSQHGLPPSERWPEVPNKSGNGFQNPRLPQNPSAKQRQPKEQPPRLPALDFGPSTSRPAPPSPLLAAKSLSFDQSRSQPTSSSPSSQPEAARSKSQRDHVPRVPSPSRPPQKSTTTGQDVNWDHRIREHDDKTVISAKHIDSKSRRGFAPSGLASIALPAEPFDWGKPIPPLPKDYLLPGTTQERVPHAEITSLM